ncbi:hypothetical protein [Leuconostoc pseudomesenteroides]|uniref:hypothetical protein n=1 Tax=Leuconostoc pseudomesenteroides TaxID=33968 RepID=UPI002286C379|nr:hypothetical protein [Leuconostoc pseudomesenteroides]WAM38549.1 hypothetical protein OYT93_10225 [Leuconostoc pseudomesenteroides]
MRKTIGQIISKTVSVQAVAANIDKDSQRMKDEYILPYQSVSSVSQSLVELFPNWNFSTIRLVDHISPAILIKVICCVCMLMLIIGCNQQLLTVLVISLLMLIVLGFASSGVVYEDKNIIIIREGIITAKTFLLTQNSIEWIQKINFLNLFMVSTFAIRTDKLKYFIIFKRVEKNNVHHHQK